MALIGGGLISEQHLAALTGLDNVRVVAVCDLSESLARFTAERFGVAHWFTDFHQMLKTVDCNVVHVLTPPATHDAIVRECIRNGCDVVVEKPIALNHKEFLSLWEYACEHGRQLIENQNYRFNTPIARLRELVASGCLGSIEEVEVRMQLPIREGGRLADQNSPHPSHRLPAGALHEFITHLAYLFLEFLPSQSVEDIAMVRAAWRNHGGGEVFKYDDLDALITAGTVHGRIRFSARQFPDCFAVHVKGSSGHARAELFHPVVEVVRTRPVGKHLMPLANALSIAACVAGAGFGGIWRKIRNRTAYEGLHRFVKMTYQAWGNGMNPPVGFREMDEVSRLVDALLKPENQI